ncbi:hypothetical protein COF46_22850 [Bacillus pseudomycoides]|uniref:Uncharacterized protein n=1 Tax=Bacillus pseudomycoides TaxID=64104 RepID=A0AAJ1Z8D2_9BACI|nr:hypothetical protein [Bacillus pseudomycoides]PEF22154.1 hypothetical protein CON69_23815 [Bacillus pseudomycoides]PEJ21468.1 hypothetical protein CN887_25235 [Bacillus pseudomycoides]PEP73622.1 hypothetical protein CN584_28475 [Bacillus pseudomycoides]PFZ88531.1 hypothetical protein COL70_19715 [Bacillus pseudomycoides]
MIFPSFSPPTCKLRNICQDTIKYTNFDYNKSKIAERCSFKGNFENMKHDIKPVVTRDTGFSSFFFVSRIWQKLFHVLDVSNY